jgi:hypothetical protein
MASSWRSRRWRSNVSSKSQVLGLASLSSEREKLHKR